MKSNCNGIRYDSCQNTCQEYGLLENIGNAYQCTIATEDRITVTSTSENPGSSENSESLDSKEISEESLKSFTDDSTDKDGSGTFYLTTNISMCVILLANSLF